MIFNSTSYAESAEVSLIKLFLLLHCSSPHIRIKTLQSLTFGLVSFLLFSSLSIAAPPSPYHFFNVAPTSGELVPKAPQSKGEFLEALKDCCLAKEQGILQSDGIEYVLALKVDFADMPGRRSSTELNQYLFATEGVSLKTYYKENSYGQMDVQPGPMGGVVPAGHAWIRAKKPMTYYGEGARNIVRYRELISEVCQAVDAKVDFSEYDRDKDGIVDHIFLIHAGNDEASTAVPDDIWSVLTPAVNIVHDGVRIDTAVIVAEEPDFEKPHLGIYFHEFFHDFGAPDVYGLFFTDPSDHKWGLMGAFGPYQGPAVLGLGNGLAPSHIMGYLKWDFDARPENGRVGWIEPVEITQNGQIAVPSFELPPKTNKLFKIDIPSVEASTGSEAREFFLIENRYKASGATFDTYLPESGILIWHIDETWVRPPGNYDAAQQIWLEDPADPEHLGINKNNPGFIDIQTITDGAAYSADDAETAFTPGTVPNSHANDGRVSGISLTNIGAEGFTMPLLVSFGDTYEPNDTLASAFPIKYGHAYESFLFDAGDTRDVYQVEAVKGVTIRVTLANIPPGQGYRLSLLKETGKTGAIGESAPDVGGLKLYYQPDATGTFYLIVESDGGFSSVDSYRLRVEQLAPEPFAFVETRVYPNPQRAGDATVTFAYQLAASQSADTVSLEIFMPTGDLVYKDMHKNVFAPGKFRWRGETRNGRPISSGIYIYRISAAQADIYVQEIGRLSVAK